MQEFMEVKNELSCKILLLRSPWDIQMFGILISEVEETDYTRATP